MASAQEVALILRARGGDSVEREFARASGAAQNFERRLANIETQARTTAVATTAIVATMVAQIVQKVGEATVGTGIRFNAMAEQAQVAFTTLLGSGERATAFLTDLQQLADRTSFEMPGLRDAGQRLLAMGFAAQAVIPMLGTMADGIAAMAGGQAQLDRLTMVFGQIAAKGRLMAEELMQFQELGINAGQAVADKLGVSVPEALERVTAGSVDARTAIVAVLESIEQQAGGMSAKLATTLGGLWTTLKDRFAQGAGELLKPVTDRLTVMLQGLETQTGGEGFKTMLRGWAQELDATLTRMAPIADFMGTAIPRAAELAGQGLDLLGQRLERIGQGDFTGLASDIARDLQTAFVSWAPVAAERLGTLLDAIANDIGAKIEEHAPEILKTARDEWAPAISEWVLEVAAPRILEDLSIMAGRIGAWAAGEGKTLIWNAGLTAGEIYRDAWAAAIAEIPSLTQQIITRAQQAVQELSTAGGHAIGLGGTSANERGQMGPPVTGPTSADFINSGGIDVLRSDAAANVAAAETAWREWARNAGIIASDAGNEVGQGAAEGVTEGLQAAAGRQRTNWEELVANLLSSSGKAGSSGRAGGTVRERAEKVAETAIQGFMDALSRNEANFAAQFSELGARIATSLSEAITSNEGGAGRRLAGVMEEMVTRARQAGITNWRQLGDDLAGSFHDALLQRTEQAKQAALDKLQELDALLRQADIFNPGNLGAAFARATQGSNLGPGAGLMENLETAIREGGARVMATIAQSAIGIRDSLFNTLPVDVAASWAEEVFGAVARVAEEKSQEAMDNLRNVLAYVQQQAPLLAARIQADERINVALQDTELAMQRITAETKRQITEMQSELALTRQIAEERRALADAAQRTIETAQNRVNFLVHERQLLRENADMERQQLREREQMERGFAEAADERARTRAQQLADVRRNNQPGGTPVGGLTSQPNRRGGVDELRRQWAIEDQRLEEREAKERAVLTARQQLQRSDRERQRTEQTQDANYRVQLETTIVEPARRRTAEQLRDFETRIENEAAARREAQLQGELPRRIAELQERLDTIIAVEETRIATMQARVEAMNAATWENLTGAWGQVHDWVMEMDGKIKSWGGAIREQVQQSIGGGNALPESDEAPLSTEEDPTRPKAIIPEPRPAFGVGSGPASGASAPQQPPSLGMGGNVPVPGRPAVSAALANVQASAQAAQPSIERAVAQLDIDARLSQANAIAESIATRLTSFTLIDFSPLVAPFAAMREHATATVAALTGALPTSSGAAPGGGGVIPQDQEPRAPRSLLSPPEMDLGPESKSTMGGRESASPDDGTGKPSITVNLTYNQQAPVVGTGGMDELARFLEHHLAQHIDSSTFLTGGAT